jgi:hypothetical protein
MEEIGRRKGRSLREMRRLAVDRGRWKEFVQAPWEDKEEVCVTVKVNSW